MSTNSYLRQIQQGVKIEVDDEGRGEALLNCESYLQAPILPFHTH